MAPTSHAVSRMQMTIGRRAAQSCTPNTPYELAIIQYFNGGFSR